MFIPFLFVLSLSLSLKHHTNYEVIFAKIDSFQVVPVSDLSTDDSPSLLNTEPVLKIVFFHSLSLSLCVYPKNALTVGLRITVQLSSGLTRLDLAKEENMMFLYVVNPNL